MIIYASNLVRRHPNWAALILFALVTMVAARPFLGRLDSVIIGRDPDVYTNPWADWWTEKALSEPDITFWKTDYLFYPEGANLTFHSFSHLNSGVSLLLRPFFGGLTAYNLTILINYFLAGLAMFQLAHYLTGSAVAGLLAGIVFAFNSHSLFQSAHPVLVSTWCIPWATLFLLRAVREDSMPLSAAAAFFVVLAAAASTLLLLLMGIWLLILGAYQLLARKWTLRSWRVLSGFSLMSLALSLPFLFPLLREAIQGNDSFVIANPTDSIAMEIIAPLVPHWFLWFKRGLYIGLLPGILLIHAVRENRAARPWFALFLGAFFFAIGPRPSFFGFELGVTLPWSWVIAPILRNTYRVNVFFAFALAMLVALGWIAYRRRLHSSSRRRTLVAVSVTLLLLIDYLLAPIPFTVINVSPFYTEYLERIPDDVALATVPFGRQEGKQHLFYQTFHGHKITGGFIARPAAETLSFILANPLLKAGAVDLEPTPIPSRPLPHLKELANANIGYLVIDKTEKNDVGAWRRAIPLRPTYEDEFVLVYETEP